MSKSKVFRLGERRDDEKSDWSLSKVRRLVGIPHYGYYCYHTYPIILDPMSRGDEAE